jgi:transposase InsO family protein
MLKAKAPTPRPTEAPVEQVVTNEPAGVVTAKRPNHVWHVDLTIVPTGGFWTAWLPFSLPQCWPFCWWVACIVDHFSRKVMGIAIFRKQPSSKQVSAFLAKTIRETGARPEYIISDKGPQFWCKLFKRWCRRWKIRPRFGAVGQYGSIAVIERFIRTLKEEGLRRVLIPLNLHKMRQHLDAVACCHYWLGGRTPDERYRRIPSACRRPRFEPRAHWPSNSPCAAPPARVRSTPGVCLRLVVDYHDGCRHLPIVTLRRAA